MEAQKPQPAYPDLPRKLSALIRLPTISAFKPEEENEQAFSDLKDKLAELFPKVHATMEKEEPSPRALLFTWKGMDPSLKPSLLCAHFDVVPAKDDNTWKHGPFSGDIAEDAVWGRGAQDIKVLLSSILEAAETLILEGFKPKRTIYLAFGGDEEVGGLRGAGAIGALLASKGVKASFLIDEGGPISLGMLSFVRRDLALVGVAEKGYIDLVLRAKGEGGHASMPPKRTAPGNLARAIVALEAKPSKARLTKTLRSFLIKLAPESAQPYRFLFSNLWLTAPLILTAFGAAPTTNALIRSTNAVTMLAGSPKENVLADYAEATVNVRILPGESSASVIERIDSLVRPFGVEAKAKREGHAVEPSDESGTDHEGWRFIEAALAASHPETACVPFLFSAGTDTKHYRNVVEAMYRFTCLPQTKEDLAGVHGDNEKVRLSDLDRCVLFYVKLIASL
ncbi:MAG: M20/M25/M40 family metallo-hydrolase [Spirochaetes bacterium]|nr:M20/M25/M40 family metallo-hydrolase [Spirochaetota bacterium]